jgi:hypothetical protein
MARKKPWCLRADVKWDHLETSSRVKILYMSFVLRESAKILSLIYGTIIFSMAVYNEVTSWGDFWDTLRSDIGLLYYSLAMWFVAVCMVALGRRWAKRLVLPARCQICPNCFYDLSARPREIDTCPECGLNAPRRECVRLWCNLLRSRF